MTVGVIDDRFVRVCDGVGRPLERPKKKNVRHLDLIAEPRQEVVDIIESGRCRNAEIKEWLKEYDIPAGERDDQFNGQT